jgi:uncharacterized lipoprotein YmbA
MSRLRAASLRSLALLAGYSLTACNASPPTRYYTLQSEAAAGSWPPGISSATATSGNQVVVRLEPVVIPPELDRLELVSRSGPYRIRIADTERWAAPLDDQIRRVLSDDLAVRLPPHLLADPNEPAGNDPRRLLSVVIAEFYADDACATTLRAAWSLRSPSGDSERGTEQLRQPPRAACAGAVPAAMSAALGMLADRLAAAILVQPAGPGSP